MSEAERRRLDHVVLPRRLPGLALLERYFPSPADNVLDAELAGFARPGDTVLDPWAGIGWTARRAVAHGLRAVAADPSPFAQLAATAFLLSPGAAALDAGFAQLAASRQVDVPLRQHVEELYATRCAACRRPVVGDQFIWPRDADAPARKIYRCASCDLSVGGPAERVAATDETDFAKLGIDPVRADEVEQRPTAGDADDDLPEAPVGLTEPDDLLRPLGEAGAPPPPPRVPADPPLSGGAPHFASTVRPDPIAAAAGDVRRNQHYAELRDRFPVLDDHHDLVDEILQLYTPRNLHALQAIADKIDVEFRDQPMAAVFRLALASCLLPASRLNGYPGRVASLRIGGGHVRQPASRYQREVNVWQLFTAAVADVRTALQATDGRGSVRLAAGFDELDGIQAANVLWIRCRPAVVAQYLPADSIDVVLGSPRVAPSVDELSFEYLATAWLMGREAAQTLRLEPLFGSTTVADAAESTATRHAMASIATVLKPDGACNVLLEGSDVDRMLNVVVAAAAAGLDLVELVPRESRRSGDAVTLHFRKPSAEDRLRQAVQPRPLRLGVEEDRLTYPELADAMQRAAVRLLQDRGEPAGLVRIAASVLLQLQQDGLLPRVAALRGGSDAGGEEGDERMGRGGAAVLATLLREELWRDDHPALLRLGDGDATAWWLREPELADSPLVDRVEWAAFSVLTTAGRLTEDGFLARIFALFPGLAAPDEELVRACLAAYASVGDDGVVHTEEDLAARLADHARVLRMLAEYGHRLGLKVWISRREQDRAADLPGTLGDLLHEEERRVYLPLVIRAPAEALGAVDAIWYRRARLAFLFEVEWTAMLGEPVLRRGRQIPVDEHQARFLVVPASRTDLLRLKLDRSPWLRDELTRQNWHVLKWQHLETLTARDGAQLEWLEPILGLDPLIERGGEQLTMFGE